MTLRYIKLRLARILWHSDMDATRFSIAMASLFAALLLFFSDISLANKPSMYFVNQVFNEITLGFVFLTHAVLSFRQLLLPKVNKHCVLANSIFGCALWSWVGISYFAAKLVLYTTFSPSLVSAAGIAISLACWWLLVRITLEGYCHAR